jgi:hypothetical protein
MFPFRVDLTEDFWNVVFKRRQGITKDFGFGNTVANLDVA